MDVNYNTTQTQTLLPVIITVTDTNTKPSVWIEPHNTRYTADNFSLDLITKPDGYETSFWLEESGEYWVHIDNGAEHQKQLIQISQHQFLPFSVEFGVFFFTLVFAFVGVYLWHKKKIKMNPKSNSA